MSGPPALRVGAHVAVKWMDQLEYPARITKTRTRPADGLTEYLVHFDGTAASSQQNHWLGADSENLRPALDTHGEYMHGFDSNVGHVGGQFWTVERILDDRDGQHGTEYLVRWEGYKEADDSWTTDVGEELVRNYEAARRESARGAHRACAAPWFRAIARGLLTKLRSQQDCAPSAILVKLPTCPGWLRDEVREHAIDLIAENDAPMPVTERVSELAQTVGKRGESKVRASPRAPAFLAVF